MSEVLAYRCVTVSISPERSMETAALLNERAEQGWELVDITTYLPTPDGRVYERYTFKSRPGWTVRKG